MKSLPTLESALQTIFGGVSSETKALWKIRIEYVRRDGNRAAYACPSAGPAATYLDDLCDTADVRPETVHVALKLERERKHGASFEDPNAHAVSGFAMYVWVPGLFEFGGPFHDGHLIGNDGHLDLSRIPHSAWTKARTFATNHLSQCIAPPTVAIAARNAVYGFWRLRRPLLVSEATTAAMTTLQQRLARFLYAPRILTSDGVLPMPVVRTKDGTKRKAATLLWVRPKRVYDRAALYQLLEPQCSALTEPRDSPGTRRTKPPVLLEVRTLPVEWGIEDLDLPPAAMGYVSGATDVVVMRGAIAEVVQAMAAKRYGWLDVEALLIDPRFNLAQAGVGLGYSEQGLQRLYRNGLRLASDRDPPRLPYGIRCLVPLRASDGSARRFLVEGGTRQLPFSMEVTAETLLSPRRFKRELFAALGRVPYLVASRPWDALIGVGSRDPRICRRQSAGRRRSPSMKDRVLAYASKANHVEAQDRPEVPPWPLLRGGEVLFPLRHLRRHLEANHPGEPPQQKEVAAAVRAIGGGAYGTLRLGRRTYRCWSLPYPGTSPARGPTPMRPTT